MDEEDEKERMMKSLERRMKSKGGCKGNNDEEDRRMNKGRNGNRHSIESRPYEKRSR
jgi:hypothetical protein